MYFMGLVQFLTRSGLSYREVSSKDYHDSFCLLRCSVSLPWVIYFEAFYLHVVSSFSCIPVICPLQFVHFFCNLSQVYPAVLLMYFISASVILLASLALIVHVMRNVSHKFVEKIQTHILFWCSYDECQTHFIFKNFFFFENRGFCSIMWKKYCWAGRSWQYGECAWHAGVRGCAVGWGTALQTVRSHVRFQMLSLEFFIDINLPTALWPWSWLSL